MPKLSIHDLYQAPQNQRTINLIVVKNLGWDAAIILSELHSRHCKYAEEGVLTEDGFFFVRVEDMKETTFLSADKQEAAIKKLESLGIIKKEKRGVPAKRYFKINSENEDKLFLYTPQQVAEKLGNCQTTSN